MTQSPSSLLARSLDWLTTRTRKVISIIKGQQKIKKNNHQILKYPNLPRHTQHAKNYGLKRVRAKMGDNHNQDKVVERLKQSACYWARRDAAGETQLEICCPICMEYMVGPVTTPCGHSFCWECLDEAYLLSPICPVCPVCRFNIDKTPLNRCFELQAIIINLIRKNNHPNEQLYTQRLQNFQLWIAKRLLKPNKLKPSDLVDVRDTQGIWCAGVIKDVMKVNGNPAILVHYIGWSSLYDEIIEISSQRLAGYKMYTSRGKLPHYEMVHGSQLQGYVVGSNDVQFHNQSESDEDSLQEDVQLRMMSEESESSHSVEQQVECVSQTYRQLQVGNPEDYD